MHEYAGLNKNFLENENKFQKEFKYHAGDNNRARKKCKKVPL